jgi:hypothetical protein
MKYSFDCIGTFKGMDVHRTIIARSDAITTEEDFAGIKQLFDTCLDKRWVWVVDCSGMNANHYMNIFLVRKLYAMIQQDHKDSVQHIWVLNINWWMHTMLSLFVTKKVEVLSAERLELFVQLRQKGCSDALANHLLSSTPL